MDDEALLAVMRESAAAVAAVLADVDDWGLAGTRPGQHHSDLVADAAATAVLVDAGLDVVSEESGLTSTHGAATHLAVVLDPLDGSTNAAHGLPWYATSLCAVDEHGPRVALVVNVATGERFEAIRGGGATCDGAPIAPSGRSVLGESLVAVSGWPEAHLGWQQYRAVGAAALDLCSVASGRFDAYVDCSTDAHGPWDYMGALLVCSEAGASVVDAAGRDLVVVEPDARRTPVAAATPELLAALLLARARSTGDR